MEGSQISPNLWDFPCFKEINSPKKCQNSDFLWNSGTKKGDFGDKKGNFGVRLVLPASKNVRDKKKREILNKTWVKRGNGEKIQGKIKENEGKIELGNK